MTVDHYRYWLEEMRGVKQDRDTTEDVSGFWRIVGARTKPDHPVAIWQTDGIPQLKVGRTLKTGIPQEVGEFMGMRWLSCIAVSEKEYLSALETGKWDDGKPARKLTEDEALGVPPDGDNKAPPREVWAEMVVTVVDALSKITKITTQEEAIAAKTEIEHGRAVYKKGDGMRVEEKRPHDERSKDVQTWYVPRMDCVTAEGGRVGRLVTAFQVAVDRKLEEERRAEQAKIDEANVKAEAEHLAKLEAERAEAEAAGVEVEEQEFIPQADAKVTKSSVSSAHGRATSVRMVNKGKITDIDLFFQSIKDDEDVQEFLTKKVNALARSKSTLPGMKIVKERK